MNQKISVLGIPLDFNSSHLYGAALGPQKIRELLQSGAMNWAAENGQNLEKSFQDSGDIVWSTAADAFAMIRQTITNHLQQGDRVLSLGGDHSVTFPIIEAYAKYYPDLTILHFDAHSDIYHDFEGNPHSHASPFARIMEAGLVKRLVQVGIRTITPHQREQIERFNVEVLEMRDWSQAAFAALDVSGDVYISFDLDGLDPACAPGVSHHEPGGLMTREVLSLIQNLEANVVGADIVEYNPKQDFHNHMTGFVAAKLMKEILAKML